MGTDDPGERAAGVLRAIELPDGRRAVVRRATREDVPAVCELYGRLSKQDLHRRFFTSRMPTPEVVEQWISPERAGSSLVVDAVDGDARVVIAEAGYSLLPDGDGELAITVDPDWRGGLGTWLLDALVDEAAANGVLNLHADVLLRNRPMIGMLRRRGTATVEHPDLGEVRMVIGTTSSMPGWAPAKTRPRLLVEGVKGLWWGEHLARDAGFELRVCAGSGDGDGDGCPALRGEDCPLVDGADIVLSLFGPDDPHGSAIVDRLRCSRPGLTIVVPSDEFDVGESGIDLIDGLSDVLPQDTIGR